MTPLAQDLLPGASLYTLEHLPFVSLWPHARFRGLRLSLVSA